MRGRYSSLVELEAERVREWKSTSKIPLDTPKGSKKLSGDVRLAEPTPRQLLVAAELRLAGHRDLFDCLGYGCAVAIGGRFLSEDRSLKRFLERLGRRDLDPEMVISTEDVGT